jgi:cell division septation protein DedD
MLDLTSQRATAARPAATRATTPLMALAVAPEDPAAPVAEVDLQPWSMSTCTVRLTFRGMSDTHALEPLADAVEEPEWDPVEERVLEPDEGAVMLADEAESVAEPEAVAEPDAGGSETETPCICISIASW